MQNLLACNYCLLSFYYKLEQISNYIEIEIVYEIGNAKDVQLLAENITNNISRITFKKISMVLHTAQKVILDTNST